MITGADAGGALGGIQEAGHLLDIGTTDELVKAGGEHVGDEVGKIIKRARFHQPAVKLILQGDLALQFLGRLFQG